MTHVCKNDNTRQKNCVQERFSVVGKERPLLGRISKKNFKKGTMFKLGFKERSNLRPVEKWRKIILGRELSTP